MSSKAILKNASWLFIFNIINAFISFAASALLSRKLDIESYANLQLILTFFMFLQTIEALYNPIILKEIYLKKNYSTDSIISSYAVLNTFFSTIITFVSLTVYFIDPKDFLLYILFLLLAQFLRLSNSISFIFDARLQSKETQKFQTFSNIVSSTFKVLILFFSTALSFQVFSIFLNYMINLILHTRKFGIKLKNYFLYYDINLMKLLVKKSLPLFFVSLITFIVFRVDILLLQFFEKKEDIAFYTNAVKLSEPWVFLSTAIAASLFPRLLALKKMSQLRYYKALRAKILIVIALSVSLSLVLSFFSPFIVTTLFGSKYIPTIDLFRIHVWSNVFLFLAAAQSNWDVLENKTQYSAYKTLVAAIYNVIANLIFIPKYGALACTVNSLITYFILSIGGNILFKKTRYFNKQIILSAKEWSRLKLFLTDIIKRQINSLKE